MYGIKPITIVKNSDMSDDLDILAISSNLKKKPLNKKKKSTSMASKHITLFLATRKLNSFYSNSIFKIVLSFSNLKIHLLIFLITKFQVF